MLFPAENSGLSYLKAVKAPMPHLPIMPTGGITVENDGEWIANGPVCLGVGSSLMNKKLKEMSVNKTTNHCILILKSLMLAL